MARRRHQDDNPARFTTGEVAKATGLPVRSIIYLCDQGLLPAEGGGSRATHRELGSEGLGRAAVIAPLYNSGIDVAKAARLVEGLADDPDIGKKISNNSFTNLIMEDEALEGPIIPAGIQWGDEAYYLHQYTRKQPHYKAGFARAYDNLIEIHNGEIVILTNTLPSENGLKISDEGTVVFLIRNLEGRSTTIEFEHPQPSRNTYELKRYQLMSLVRVNIHLVMRNTFDRIAAMRE